MRNVMLCMVLGAGLGGCSQEPPPMPTAYIKLKYDLTPGSGTGDTPYEITLRAADQMCGRDSSPKEIVVTGYRRAVAVRLTLRGPATAESQVTAQSNTAGNVQMEFKVPRDLDLDMGGAVPTLSFSTADAGNALLCTIRTRGADLFSAFQATFSCVGNDTANGRLNVSDGEIAAVPCPLQ